jgi:NitT/TauT family transport system substrate-binding protein
MKSIAPLQRAGNSKGETMWAIAKRAVCVTMAALGVYGAFCSSVSAQQRQAKMVLSWAFTGEESPFVLADEGGYFRNEGVAVQVDRGYGSGDTITKVASGAYEFGLADLSAVIAFNAKQGSTKVIGIYQFGDTAPLAILSLPETRITKPSDLVGKRIGAPPGDSSRIMFPAFARANNLDATKVTWIDVAPQLRNTMLVQKQVDAISGQSTHVPDIRKLTKGATTANTLKYSEFGLNLYGHAVIATPEFAAKNGDLIRAFLRGTVAAMKKAIADPAAPIQALQKRDSLVDKDLEAQRFAANLESAVLTENVRKNGLSSISQDRLAEQSRIVTTALNLPAFDVKALYRLEFLPARPELQIPR